MLCSVPLPTPQAMQWGQRSFEIEFEILVIFVDLWLKTCQDHKKKLNQKEHLIGVPWKVHQWFVGVSRGFIRGFVRSPSGSIGVHQRSTRDPMRACLGFILVHLGPLGGNSGVNQGFIGDLSKEESVRSLSVTKFGELIWTALQIENWCHHPKSFIETVLGFDVPPSGVRSLLGVC